MARPICAWAACWMVLAGPVLAADMQPRVPPLPAPATPQATSPQTGVQSGGLMDAMNKMNAGMAAAKMTGDPDHDFAVMMIPHHQGAIDMAIIELDHGRDPKMRKLAASVVKAQENEIALMQAWLEKHPK